MNIVKILVVLMVILTMSGCAGTDAVKITSDPPGVKIDVDDGYIGETPCEIELGWICNVNTSYRKQLDHSYTVCAYPSYNGQKIQSKRLSAGQELPKNIHFLMGGAQKPFKVMHFYYDNDTNQGKLSVNTYGRGIECREWLIKNIGVICSSKNITLQAGSESNKGGYYRLLDEKIVNNILIVNFEGAW